MKDEAILKTPSGPKTNPMADPPGRSPAMKHELDQLRQRGLTKSLNKHFTQECKKVEAELAAAEAAFAELEARKARASEFAPSSNEITQLDMMCMKVAEWKRQCRKNEQETVMLYARYCEKFGNSIELAKPEQLVKSSKNSVGPAAASDLANVDVGTLVKAFDEAEFECHGIPDFLRPSEASAPSSFNNQELEEILEDASLPDPDAPCKALTATPQTEVMDSDLDDSSIVSGLTTLNSAVTREVLHDVENKVLDFIKNETENIRKMMEEDALSKAEPSIAVSHAASHSADSVKEHENMVARMQQILNDFKKAEEETKQREEKGTMVQPVEGGNPGEEWYEHYDDTFQRSFYVEAKTNKTQWERPQIVTDVSVTETSLSESADSAGSLPAVAAPTTTKVSAYDEFIPEPRAGRPTKRVELYRARVRRQRNRQLAVVGLVVAVMGAGAMYYKITNPEQMDSALGKVANVIGLDRSSTVEVDVKPKESVTKRNRKKVDAPAKDPVKTTEAKKAETKTPEPSSTPSVPVASSKKKAQAPTPTEEAQAPPTKREERPAPVKQEVKKETETAEAPLATFKPETQHWILDVLFGPVAFKGVNRKCFDNERYCGLYHY